MRRSMHIPTLAFLGMLGVLSAPAVWAEDGAPQDPSPFSFSLSGSLGTETLSGDTYQSFGLLPDFGWGNLGVGLDLTFHFRFYEYAGGEFGFYPRAEDWWDKSLNLNQNLDKYLSRILYVRWGHKGDPLYVQAGLLPTTTLGSGFLVGGYTNGALRPEYKYTGVILDAKGELIGLPYGGFESFVGNISTFDVMGLRTYVNPFALAQSDSDFLKQIQVGVTVAGDTNVYAQSTASGSGAVIVSGVDTMVPLYRNDWITAVGTADIAAEGSHAGGAIGVGGKAVTFLQWKLENRFLGDNFIADYFDRSYEISRVDRYQIYNSGSVVVPGTIGWSASLGTSILGDTFTMGATLSGPWTAQSDLYAQPKLEASAGLKADALPINLDAYYIKYGITDFGKLASPEDALIGAKVGYRMGAVTLNVVYNLRYVPASESTDNGQQWITTSRLETVVKF